MVPNIAAVHAIIIANAHRRHEEEHKRECQRKTRTRRERTSRTNDLSKDYFMPSLHGLFAGNLPKKENQL